MKNIAVQAAMNGRDRPIDLGGVVPATVSFRHQPAKFTVAEESGQLNALSRPGRKSRAQRETRS
jgi:hypothetical protein